MGTVHGYGTWVRWARYMGAVVRYFRNLLMKNELKDLFYLHKSVARSVANWVRMVGTVGTLDGYGTQYLTYVPKCRTYVPMYRTMRTLFTVPVLLSKPYLKKVANRALLLKIDKV